MTIVAADTGHTYLDLHDLTKEKKYLEQRDERHERQGRPDLHSPQ